MTDEQVQETQNDDAAVEDTTEVEETAEQVNEPSESSTENADTKPKDKSFGKRIDELTQKRREAEREAAYWREMAMNQQKPEPIKPTEPEALKTLADFEYDEGKYQTYVMEQARKEASEAAVNAARQTLTDEQQQREIQRKHQEYSNRENKYAESLDDYWQVARGDFPVSQAMADAITESPDGPAVLYYLGKNQDVAGMIAQLPEMAAAREIGKIEAKLSQEAASPTKTPPPPGKIGGVEAGIEEDPDNMSTEKWLKWREKQLAKR